APGSPPPSETSRSSSLPWYRSGWSPAWRRCARHCGAATRQAGIYRLLVPAVIQDDKLPRAYPRITFEREIATRDWERREEPAFLAVGHPRLQRTLGHATVN